VKKVQNEVSPDVLRVAQDVLRGSMTGGITQSGQQKMQCPLPEHPDQKSSASVNWVKGIWYCQVCQPKGFGATLRGLMVSMGHMERRDTKRTQTVREEHLSLDELASRWHGALIGSGVYSYLQKERSISSEMIVKTQIGWCAERKWVAIPLVNDEGRVIRFKYRQCREGGEFDSDADPKYAMFPFKGDNAPKIFPVQLFDREGSNVYITAGELDSLVLHSNGYNAISSTRGEGFYPDELIEAATEKHVVICLDNDDPGMTAAWNLARILHGRSQSIRILKLPDECKDVTDYFRGHSKEDFEAMSIKALRYEPSSVDGSMGIYAVHDCYVANTAKGMPQVLSTFVLNAKEIMHPLNESREDVMLVECRSRQGKVRSLMLPVASFHSAQSLQSRLGASDLVWYGSDKYSKALLTHLVDGSRKESTYSETLGWHQPNGQRAIVLPDKTYGASIRWWHESPSSYFKFDVAEGCSKKEVADVVEGVSHHVKDALHREISLPLLGWYHAAFLAPFFRKQFNHFPILICSGVAGSGKTETNYYILARMLGMKPEPVSSIHRTHFSLRALFNQSCSFPVILDEFTPHKFETERTRFIHAAMHLTYEGSTEEIGSKDLSLRGFRFSAPMAVLGESESLMDTEALVERAVFVHFPAAHIRESNPASFFALESLELSKYAYGWYQHCLEHPPVEAFMRAGEKVKDLRVPKRVRDNMTCVIAGTEVMREYWESHDADTSLLDVKWEDVFSQSNIVENPLWFCDHFIADLDVMAQEGVIKAGEDYRVETYALHFHLLTCFRKWMAWSARQRRQGADLNTLRRQLRERRTQYVMDTSKAVRLQSSGSVKKTVEVNLRSFCKFYPEPLNQWALEVTEDEKAIIERGDVEEIEENQEEDLDEVMLPF